MLGIYWIGHHTQFHFVRGVNRALLWLNIFFFMIYAAAIGVSLFDSRLALLLIAPVLHILPGRIHLHWTR